jgi:excisionase family DNA binding protein
VRVVPNREIAEELLTVAEVAAALKVPVSWVYERTRRSGTDQIPHFKLGKYLRFHWSTLREWLENLKQH